MAIRLGKAKIIKKMPQYNFQKNYLSRTAVIAGLALLLTSQPTKATLETKILERSHHPIPTPQFSEHKITKEQFYNLMEEQGWEFYTNYNPTIKFTPLGLIISPREYPETILQVLSEFSRNEPTYRFNVREKAFDEKGDLMKGIVYSIWRKPKTK